MATPFSRFCGGCSVLNLGHAGVSLYALAHYIWVDVYPLAAAALAGYIVLERAQSTARTSPLQLAQSVLCLVAAVDSAKCSDCAALIWFELCSAVVHLAAAMALFEILRIGDCRNCMQEAYRCECGAHKDPVPPGALAHLVGLIEARWIPVATENEQETENEQSSV